MTAPPMMNTSIFACPLQTMMMPPFLGTTDYSYEDRVLADRFRTKMCAKFMENNGWCPYESRCMFAHGEHQLRTTEMNLQEGLVTETAIKEFKFRENPPPKKNVTKKKRANKRREKKAKTSALAPQDHRHHADSPPTVVLSRGGSYRRDPYAFVAVLPHHQCHPTRYDSSADLAMMGSSMISEDGGMSSSATSMVA